MKISSTGLTHWISFETSTMHVDFPSKPQQCMWWSCTHNGSMCAPYFQVYYFDFMIGNHYISSDTASVWHSPVQCLIQTRKQQRVTVLSWSKNVSLLDVKELWQWITCSDFSNWGSIIQSVLSYLCVKRMSTSSASRHIKDVSWKIQRALGGCSQIWHTYWWRGKCPDMIQGHGSKVKITALGKAVNYTFVQIGFGMNDICLVIDTGPLFTKKTPSYGYRDHHSKPMTVWRQSKVYNGNPYADKTASS